MKIWPFLILSLLCCCLSLEVMGEGRADKEKRVKTVQVVPAVRQEVVYPIVSTGTLLPEADTDVSCEVDGVVKEIHFEEGQEVRAGDLLITLKDEEYRFKVQEAEARLTQTTADRFFAEKLFERMEKLYNDGVISVQEYDDHKLKLKQAEANLEAAQATLDLAKKNLRDTKILAPFNGIISKKYVDIGTYVKKGDTKLLNIVKIDPIKVELSIPEKYLSMVEEGEVVTVSVEAYPKKVFKGEIYYINPKILSETRRFQCYARLANPEKELKPGLFVTAKVEVGTSYSVVIPEEAVVSEEGVNYCFLVEGRRAKKAALKTGIKLKDGMQEVLEGVKEGSLVVVRGQYVLLDGDIVEAERFKVAKEEVK